MPSRHRSKPTPPRRERRRGRRDDAAEVRLRCATREVELIDHSADGLAVESHESLRVGARYRFTLERSGDVESFVGTVLWCRLRETRPGRRGDVLPVYRAGIARK